MYYYCTIEKKMVAFSSAKEDAMPRKSPFAIVLTDQEMPVLESMVRKYTSSYSNVVRAKIILYAAQGLENKEIARRLDTSPQIVSKWRKRFFKKRLAGLDDESRRGRPPRFSPRGCD